MFDNILFSLKDVQKVRKSVSINIDDFEMYAQEVQRNYLQPLLGDKLYKAFVDDVKIPCTPSTDRFKDLLNGKVYDYGGEIIFRGVGLYLCYLWIYTYIQDSAIAVTPTGAKVFKDEYAEHIESKQAMRNLADHCIKSADGLEEPILKFLRVNQANYPEFSESKEIEAAEKSNMSFKVIGQSHLPPDELYL